MRRPESSPLRDVLRARRRVMVPRLARPRAQRGFIVGYSRSYSTAYQCDGAQFDGTNDYLTRGADLTGIADSKQGLVSLWIRLDGGDGNEMAILSQNAAGTAGLLIYRSSGNLLVARPHNSGGTDILIVTTSPSTYTSGSTWRHFLCSWDLTGSNTAYIYMNDVSDDAISVFTNDTIDYTIGEFAVGAYTGGSNKLNACLADVFFDDSYLDITQESNRRKFISATGKPVSLGSDGSAPLGAQPLLFLHLDNGESAANFATNRGSGGNLSVTGTLTTASTSPTD